MADIFKKNKIRSMHMASSVWNKLSKKDRIDLMLSLGFKFDEARKLATRTWSKLPEFIKMEFAPLLENPGKKWHLSKMETAHYNAYSARGKEDRAYWKGSAAAHKGSALESEKLGLENPYSSRAKFCPERIESPKKFDPRSFRTKVARAHRLTFGCPKGKWDPKTETCKVPVQLQRILHPVGEAICPIGGQEIRHNVTDDQIEAYALRLYQKGVGVDSVSRELKREFGLRKSDADYFARRASRIARGAVKYVSPTVKRARQLELPLEYNPRDKWYFGLVTQWKTGRIFSTSVKPTKKRYPQFKKVIGPFSSRKEAESFAHQSGYDVYKDNPPADMVEIYDNILAIEAKKGSKSLFQNERFRHDFDLKKGKAKIYGLPDGSLLIKGNKKLWRKFNYD
jgi:hypothetical protein